MMKVQRRIHNRAPFCLLPSAVPQLYYPSPGVVIVCFVDYRSPPIQKGGKAMTGKSSQDGLSRRDFVAATGAAAIVGSALAATATPGSAAPMRNDVEFKTQDGVTLRGWHYLPDQRSGKVPTIVMAHGFSAVKEMYLDMFGAAFAAAGLAAVVFDNR